MSAEAVGWVWKHSPVTKSALLVHLALADVTNDMHQQELWCSTDTLSRKTRVGRTSVVTAIDKLVEMGLLSVVEERPGRTTKYRFLYPDLPVQFSEGSRETPVQKPDGGVQNPDGTRPETEHELNRTQADNLFVSGNEKCGGWADVEGAKVPTVARCALPARHHGPCKPTRHLESVETPERKDIA